MSGQLTDSAVRATVEKEYFPNQLTVIPRDGETVTVGDDQLTWHALDTTNYNVNLYHFAYALNRPTSNVLFWAVTRVEVPREIRNVRLAIGSNAASIWWLNGQEVIGIYGDRQAVIDDGVSKRVTLNKGLNTIRAAVINAGGATDFCARFLDADDNPVKGISVRLSQEQPLAATVPTIVPVTRQNSASRANASQVDSICEVKEAEGFTRKIEDVREADFRLANRRLQPLGHLTAKAKSD